MSTEILKHFKYVLKSHLVVYIRPNMDFKSYVSQICLRVKMKQYKSLSIFQEKEKKRNPYTIITVLL